MDAIRPLKSRAFFFYIAVISRCLDGVLERLVTEDPPLCIHQGNTPALECVSVSTNSVFQMNSDMFAICIVRSVGHCAGVTHLVWTNDEKCVSQFQISLLLGGELASF